MKTNPLPEFNAYSMKDVIKNFWILGVIIGVSIPYFISAWLYCTLRGPEMEFWNKPEMILLHSVIIFKKRKKCACFLIFDIFQPI